MSDLTPAERARALAYLRENNYNWASMVEINAENKRNGHSHRMKDGRVEPVWSEIEAYVRDAEPSETLLRFVADLTAPPVRTTTPSVPRREESSAMPPQLIWIGVAGAVIAIVVYLLR